MKGGDWSDYFQTLEEEDRQSLLAAFQRLHANPVIRREYGIQFGELAALIENPLPPYYSTKAAQTIPGD